MLNHKNLQNNLRRKGDVANSKIVGTSSWTKTWKVLETEFGPEKSWNLLVV